MYSIMNGACAQTPSISQQAHPLIFIYTPATFGVMTKPGQRFPAQSLIAIISEVELSEYWGNY